MVKKKRKIRRGSWRGGRFQIDAASNGAGAEAEAFQELARKIAGVARIDWKFSAADAPRRARIEALRYMVTGRVENV